MPPDEHNWLSEAELGAEGALSRPDRCLGASSSLAIRDSKLSTAGRPSRGRLICMSSRPTVRVEISNEILERLRDNHPGKTDREVVEEMIRDYLERTDR